MQVLAVAGSARRVEMTCVRPYFEACNGGNGKGCRNTMPSPGAKGGGTGLIRNRE